MPENVKSSSSLFRSPVWYGVVVIICVLVFWTDLLTPLGFAHGGLYIFALLLASLTRNRAFLAGTAVVTSLLTIMGFFLSPPGFELTYVIINRALSVLEIAVLTILSYSVLDKVSLLEDANRNLESVKETLGEQGKLLEIASDAVHMGGWMVSLPDYHLSWSEAVRNIHQVSDEYEPTLEEALDFYTPEYRARIQQIFMACAEKGKPFDEEARLVTSEGRKIWVRVIGRAIRNAEGSITRVQGAFLDISSDKETESVLVLLQHRFRQFADSIPQIIWTADAQGEIDFTNQALNRYSGLDQESLTGNNWANLVFAEDLEECIARWKSALVSGQDYRHDMRLRRRDGSYRWHRVEAQPVYNDHKQIIKWCGSAIDIHDNKNLEQYSRKQAESLINTLESVTDAFFTLDPDWNFTYINGAAEQLLERDRDELLEKNVWHLFPQADTFRRYYQQAVDEQVTVKFLEHYQPLGKWFDVRAFPSQEGLAVYFRDVSDTHRQQEEMRQSRERFENVARVTTDAIWDWDLSSDLVWWNDSIETLFGYSVDEVEKDSRSWTSHIHPEDKDVVLSSIHQAIEGHGSEWEHEYRFQRKDGTYAFVSDRGFIIRDSEGKAVRIVGGMEDVTESRLMQERLGQSQRLEAIGQLTGGVAHDFNNLLTVIQGNSELLAESLKDDSALFPLIRMTNNAAERAAQLTKHLLAFARRQALEPEPVDIKKLVRSMEELLRRTLMENIHIEMVHGGGLWSAMVDAAQLENAILNLALNARDAMPEGGRLTIETSNAYLDQNYASQSIDVNPGQYVLIAISDTGTGIPESMLGHVFDPFFTTKEAGKGTGLGLSMVYGFVKQSQGHIRVYSEQRQGTTVRMYLPKAAEEAVTVQKPTVQLTGGNELVLLVEDDELVRLYAEHLLADLGYSVLSASDGAEALEILEHNDGIVLLFTDIIMPGGMNGRQLADRALELRPQLKVLFTSGYTENAVVHHGRLDPGVQLISKPYLRQELASKLRAVLEDKEE